MRTSTQQSRKSSNARAITALHADVKRTKATAATLYKLAQQSIADAKAMSKQIKALSKEQIVLKQALKGPPRTKRAPKADTRPKGETVGYFPPDVLYDYGLAESQLSNLG